MTGRQDRADPTPVRLADDDEPLPLLVVGPGDPGAGH
jgi:hypothetical protein